MKTADGKAKETGKENVAEKESGKESEMVPEETKKQHPHSSSATTTLKTTGQ